MRDQKLYARVEIASPLFENTSGASVARLNQIPDRKIDLPSRLFRGTNDRVLHRRQKGLRPGA